MVANSAAWQTDAKCRPFEVKEAPMWKPGAEEILIRNHAVAINPIDWKLQKFAIFPLQYPTIFGSDAAGEVVEIGSKVTDFKVGDRVTGLCVFVGTERLSNCGFQAYVCLASHLALKLPDNMEYRDAVSIPVGICTASCSLFQQQPFLALDTPTSPARDPNGKTLFVSGGSSSVGSSAIQLAVAAGYEVLSTASPRNFQAVKKLGASKVIDYNSPTVAGEIVDALKGKALVGVLDCIGESSTALCVEVVHKAAGFGPVVTVSGRDYDPSQLPRGVTFAKTFAIGMMDNGLAAPIFGEFLPEALRAGSYQLFPKSHVIGKGLDCVQHGCDRLTLGDVSAMKLVVEL